MAPVRRRGSKIPDDRLRSIQHTIARRRGTGEGGALISTLPRGFYLRTTFTARILRQAFALPREGA